MNDIVKNGYKNYKNNLAEKFSLTSLYLTIVFLILAATVAFSPLLILLVPFIFMPFTFSYQFNLTEINYGRYKGLRGFFLAFPLYFKSIANGVYRGFTGFLKALLAYSAVILIASFIIESVDPQLIEMFDSYYKNNIDILEIYDYIEDSFLLNVSMVIAIDFALIIFLNHVLINATKLYFNINSNVCLPMKVLNVVQKRAIKKHSKAFYKDYFGSLWFVFLLFVLGIILGNLLGIFAFGFDFTFCIGFGLFLGFIFVFPFLPYIGEILYLIFNKYSSCYSEAFISISNEALDELKTMNKIPEERKSEVEKFLNESTNMLKKDDENKEDKKEDNK